MNIHIERHIPVRWCSQCGGDVDPYPVVAAEVESVLARVIRVPGNGCDCIPTGRWKPTARSDIGLDGIGGGQVVREALSKRVIVIRCNRIVVPGQEDITALRDGNGREVISKPCRYAA